MAYNQKTPSNNLTVQLMMSYLDGRVDLTSDEREILLFALYTESLHRGGLAAQAKEILNERDSLTKTLKYEAKWNTDTSVPPPPDCTCENGCDWCGMASECICPNWCDCEALYRGLVSMLCPYHNEYPTFDPECPHIGVHRNGASN